MLAVGKSRLDADTHLLPTTRTPPHKPKTTQTKTQKSRYGASEIAVETRAPLILRVNRHDAKAPIAGGLRQLGSWHGKSQLGT